MYDVSTAIVLKFPNDMEMRAGRNSLRNYMCMYNYTPLLFHTPNGEFGKVTVLYLKEEDERLELILDVLENLDVEMFPPKSFWVSTKEEES